MVAHGWNMLERHVNVLFDFFLIFGQRIRLWRFSKARAKRLGRSFSLSTRMEAVYPTTNQYNLLFPKQLLRHLTSSCAHIVTRESQFQFDENDLVMTMNVILAFWIGCCLWYHPWKMLNWRSSDSAGHSATPCAARTAALECGQGRVWSSSGGAWLSIMPCHSCRSLPPPDGDIYSQHPMQVYIIVQQYNYVKTSS